MDRLSVGMHVEIMRSDGRVHGALVTKLCHETGAVSVEWFEKGETKGKEVDLSAIMRNNPMLFQQPIVPSSPIVSAKTEPVHVSRGSRSIAPMTAAQRAAIARDAEVAEKTAQIVKSRESNIMGHLQDGNAGVASNRAAVRRSVIIPPSSVMGPPQILPSVNYNNNAENNAVEPSKRRATMAASRIPPSRTSRIGTTANEINSNRLTEVRHKDEFSPTDDTTGVISKSQVVSNVQELEKNREQRRAHQVESKKLREVQKNIDPGNPNWQFLSMIRDYQSQVDYKPLKISDGVKDNRICVCVRKRPINKKELAKREIEIITIPKKDHIIVHQPQVKVDLTKYLENQVFRFDYTFDENTTNDMVYKFTAQPLVRTIFQGGFATCFAYGQTGSGKTHTMGGIFDGKIQNCANGIYALTAMDVFKMLASNEYKSQKLTASCSFFEIYGAKVFDLLGKKAKLRVLEDGKKLVQIIGLKEFKVQTAEDVLQLIKQGSDQRTAGTTSANSNSSRSHAVFQIILRKSDNLYGKISLIDLAGNERGADTISSDRQTRLEGAEINKSLLALKECIRAMGRDVQHVPFRGSKLTLILRDSFIGKNAKTCMIAMISPGMSCVENTLNTLRYADRVKELGNENGVAAAAPLSDGDFLVSAENGGDTIGSVGADEDDQCYNGDADQDLQMLHQQNSEFMNEEAYKYQIVLENMNKAEDAAVDQHQLFFDKLQKSVGVTAGRLEETNNVEFDLEGYARNSIKDICDILTTASKCKASFECLLERIAEEQEFSRGK